MASSAASTPTFDRSLRLGIEEAELILNWYGDRPQGNRLMLDVGAHRGSSTKPFAKAGWRVHAFEPDEANRTVFDRILKDFDNVTVDTRAVSNVDGEDVTLYDSEESSGISSLIAFVDSHKPSATVKTVRLDTFIRDAGIEEVDFLKIDTEGYDLMVLQGFPWDRFTPEMVLCEFEDKKTEHLGYHTSDMIGFLSDRGYDVVISEWHPIERYGVKHSFARLSVYDGTLPPKSAWGNLIGVRDAATALQFVDEAPDLVHRRNARGRALFATARFEAWRFARRLRRARSRSTVRSRAS
jgi:FkbM family methyltransferase